AEALGPDASRIVSQSDEAVRGRLDEAGRATDVAQGTLVGRPCDLAEQRSVYASPMAFPLGRPFAREGQPDVDLVIRREAVQVVAVDDVFERPRRVEEAGRHVAAGSSAVAEHRAQRHD